MSSPCMPHFRRDSNVIFYLASIHIKLHVFCLHASIRPQSRRDPIEFYLMICFYTLLLACCFPCFDLLLRREKQKGSQLYAIFG